MFTGDPVEDKNFVLRQYLKANKKRLEDFSEMRRKIDAAITLNTNPKLIYKEFYDRGKGDLYVQVMKNKFIPFPSDMKWAHEKALEQQREKGIPNPLDGNSRILAIMEKILSKGQFLNQPFILNEEMFIKESKESGNQSKIQTPPLGDTPQPVVNTAQMAQKDPITNLTGTEEALLSPTDKVIAGRT